MSEIDTYRRFAVYFTPPPGPFRDLGAAWLGWDADRGEKRPHPEIPALHRPVEEITATPRKYGLHATLKPPFALATSSSFAALKDGVANLAASLAPVTFDTLTVARLGSFLALVPAGNTSALSALAATLVRDLDQHRAPPDHSELVKRRAKGLSAAQEANLMRWGYPYVIDEFRFHMTLTGRLSKAELENVRTATAHLFQSCLPRPFVIDAISLCGEDQMGQFHTLSRFPLKGKAQP